LCLFFVFLLLFSVYSSSSKDDPRWFMVDVQFVRMLKRYIPLSELKHYHLQHKDNDGPLKNLALFTKARLSVQPISDGKWRILVYTCVCSHEYIDTYTDGERERKGGRKSNCYVANCLLFQFFVIYWVTLSFIIILFNGYIYIYIYIICPCQYISNLSILTAAFLQLQRYLVI